MLENRAPIRLEVPNRRYAPKHRWTHRHSGTDIDIKYATETLKQIHKIWKRPVHLHGRIDDEPILFSFDGEQSTQQHIDERIEDPAHQF